jgi:tetratricopeptide (TPR) repeat protein
MTNLMGLLGNLEASGLVRVAQVEPDLEYLFRHSLVQDVAYDSLLEEDRKRLHLLVGEAIEKLYPDRLEEFSATLARHFRIAGNDKKARIYYIKAGKEALETYANKEAEIHFENALDLSRSDDDRLDLYYFMGESLYRQSHFQEALDVWKSGIQIAGKNHKLNQIAKLYARSARVAWHAGDNIEALRLSQEGFETVAGAQDSPEMAMLIHEAARSCLFNNLHEKAYQLCKKALKMAEEFNDIASQADTLATYGVLKGISIDEALKALNKSVELAEKAGYLGIAVRAYHNLASVTGEQEGGREASRQYFKKSAELGRKRGVASEEHYSLAGALGYARAAGDLEEGEIYLKRMDELVKTMVNPGPGEFINDNHRAALLFMRGFWDEGVILSRRCYQKARLENDLTNMQEIGGDLVSSLLELNLYGQLHDYSEIEDLISERIEITAEGIGAKVWPYLQLTILRARQNRLHEAHEALNIARSGEEKRVSVWRENYIGHAEAELAVAEGRYFDAISIFEEIVTRYSHLGARWSWARTLHDWAEVHMKVGSPADLERARTLLRESRTLYREMGAEGHLKWIEKRLSDLRTITFNQALASQRDAQELARAAEIQGSFLPGVLPEISGWDLAVTLEPARQTSGDFYDFIPLANSRWAIIVADVADKGTAAALFMTTTRSLIRTYSHEYEMWPEVVLSETNRRLLADTNSGIFVTVFYGILDPANGSLVYANAGHNPPFLINKKGEREMLLRTGTPLGIFEEATWDNSQIQMALGDKLIIYTDGIIDSQNAEQELFSDGCFLRSINHHYIKSAVELRDGILNDIHEFVGDAPQFDDITLMVINRLNSSVG